MTGGCDARKDERWGGREGREGGDKGSVRQNVLTKVSEAINLRYNNAYLVCFIKRQQPILNMC